MGAVVAPQASAENSRPLLKSIGFPAGQHPQAVATDSAGNFYVLEYGTEPRVEKFDPEGNPANFSASAAYISGNKLTGTPSFSSWEFDGYNHNGIAVSRTGGATNGFIYVTQLSRGISVFAPSGEFLGQFDPNVFYEGGVSVNQTTGQVYASEYFTIHRYSASTTPDGIPSDASYSPPNFASYRTATDNAGAFYLSWGEYSPGPVYKYPTSPFEPGGENREDFLPEASALTFDPASADLFVARGPDIVQVHPNGTQVGGAFGGFQLVRGVAVGTGDRVYAAEPEGSAVAIFGPATNMQAVTTGPASEVLQTTATVSGEVDPSGAGPITSCEFQWGLDASYSKPPVACSPATLPYTGVTAVSAGLTGLQKLTTYHYRLVTTGANGVRTGHDATFTTPDVVADVVTKEATSVTKNSALLNGSYRGQGLDTKYWFEFGTEYGNYTEKLPAVPAQTGVENGPQDVDPIKVEGLMGATEYHYRIVMENELGSVNGGDVSFVTPPAITELETGGVTNVGNESAELQGSFIRDELDVHYFFEWGPTEAYGNVTPALPGTEIPAGSGKVDVPPVLLENLQEGGIYHYRIAATNSAGKTVGQDRVFKTAEPPQISNLAAKNILKTSVDLTAEVNPNRGDTEWFFEWGQTTEYGNVSPVEPGFIPNGSEPVPVSTHLEGLAEGITYHFRLVATNEFGTRRTGDQAFGFYPPDCPNSQIRQETGSAHLPDCRGYELVSPANAHGTTLFPFNAPTAAYATSPSRIAFAASYGEIPDSGDPMISVADMYVSSRTPFGWVTRYVGKNARESSFMGGAPGGIVMSNTSYGPGNSFGGTFAAASLDHIVLYDLGYPAIRKGTNEVLEPPRSSPLVYSPDGTLDATWPTNVGEVPGGEFFVGWQAFDAELDHYVFSSNVAFVPGAETFADSIVSPGPIEAAEWKRGKCCPGPIYDNNTSTGEINLISEREDGSNFRGVPIEVSDNGSHILMGETADGLLKVSAPLFMRMDGKTYDIAGGAPVEFLGMDGSGSTVYFTSRQPLTADDHDTSKDLFVWKDSSPAEITRVSKGLSGNDGDRDNCELGWVEKCDIQTIDVRSLLKTKNPFQGGQVSPNGQESGNLETDNPVSKESGDVYFVSPEQLDGARGSFGQANIYLYHDGALRFVASAEPQSCVDPAVSADNPEYTPTPGPLCEAGKIHRFQVTPDGKYAAFISRSRLTPYNNNGFLEMYVYNREENRLDCASCRPDGGPPGFDTYGAQNGLDIAEDGRTFFSTSEALVPADTNKANDVYEYVEGRPQLITSGLGESAPFTGFQGYQNTSGLISVSADGTDVYFGTFERLVSQDHNGQELKIYDARQGGGFPAEPPRTACEAADECHGAGSEPPASPKDRTGSALEGNPQHEGQRKHRKHRKHKHRRHRHRKHTKHRGTKGGR
jgi:hypothetical protein